MNDQTSPTADGQGQGSSPWRNPFEEPQSAQGLPKVPDFAAAGPAGPGGPGGSGGPAGAAGAAGTERSGWFLAVVGVLFRPADLLAAAILVVTGVLLGVPAGLAWYRFAPTVWLTLPANAVSQVTSGVDQSALLVAPEAKGIASVDGYYFVFTAIVGLLLGILGFFLARRGLLGGRDREGNREGAPLGAWAGVLLGGLAASTLAAALGRWLSMPDPLTVLHTIAAGHNFHAPVALHAQGLYLAAPLLGMVLFLALTWAFTKPSPPAWEERGYFTAANPYGLPAGQQAPQPGQPGQPSGNSRPAGAPRPDGAGPGTAPGASSGAPQADNSVG